MNKETSGKIKNWIHYYKWYVVVCFLLLIFAVRYIAGILGVAEPRPDLQAAYVGRHVLSQETIDVLRDLLASKAGDYNGDGKVLVTVHQYLTSDESGADEAQQNASAAEITLIGDIDGCESYLFLLEDPEQFQIEWQILADKNGNPPGAADYSVEDKVVPIADLLPDLGAVTTGEDLDVLSSLMVGRRCFFTDKKCENADALASMWENTIHSSEMMADMGNALSEDSSGSVADSNDHETDGNKFPLPAADESGMFIVGNNICAPHDFDRLSLSEYNEALAANGFYYATWTSGTPSPITNSEGDEALLYPLQLYMITYEGTGSEDAGSKAAGWLAQARKNYRITNETAFSANGREYVILEYTPADSSNPYARGASAFLTSAGETAICAELLSVGSDDRSLGELLQSFLMELK